MNKIRYGIVGLGNQGTTYNCRIFDENKIENGIVTALCDIDENKIEEAITDRTKAIMVVHYAGVACEMDTIMDIAHRHGLFVIEDAAQAVMSTYKGRYCGTIGDFGCYSFQLFFSFMRKERVRRLSLR